MTVERSFVLKGFCPYDILGLYEEYGLDVGKHLRGDFYIEIQDGYRTVYITDFAGTKSGGVLPRNSTIVVEDNEIVSTKSNIILSDLYYNPPQGADKKDSYDDLFKAIDESVFFRGQDNPTIFLSCGHDSGSIVTGAIRNDIQFSALSYIGNEDISILSERLKFNKTIDIPSIVLSKTTRSVIPDNESHSIFAINCRTSTALSGLGVDEMYTSTDYQLMETFIKDAEVQYNKYNIDVRYPLLDPLVYKEYFYLDKKLRPNNPKKVPFKCYMDSIGYPVYGGYKKSLVVN